MIMSVILTVIVTFVISYLGIEVFRRRSLARNWVDIPNERSSHDRPVPRGGGLVIVAICLISYAVISILHPGFFGWGYFVGAGLIAAVSWLDDLFSISFGWRLLVHLLSAGLFVASTGYWQTIDTFGGRSFALGYMGPVITVCWIAWMVNAYNFMDGIDGIAGLQGLVTSAAWMTLAWFTKAEGNFFYAGSVFGACAGFLVHNWNPARIFMGDVGSAFLGFTFAAMTLILTGESRNLSGILPLAAVLFLWPFVFDSVLTMIRRTLRWERIWTAHREHLYQRLVIGGLGHGTVSLIYGAFAVVAACAGLIAVIDPGVPSSILIISILFLTAAFVVIVLRRTRALV